MDKNASTSSKPAPQSFSTPTHTDEESLNESTASETFESWTLLSDKKTKQRDAPDDSNRPTENVTTTTTTTTTTMTTGQGVQPEAASVKKDEKEEEEQPGEDEDELIVSNLNQHELDDISDGISIISESESAGRQSPHSFLNEPLGLNELNVNFGLPKRPIRLNASAFPARTSKAEGVSRELQQRRGKRSASSNGDKRVSQRTEAANVVVRQTAIQRLPSLLRRGFSTLFYLAAALAVLAFFGHQRFGDFDEFAAERGYLEVKLFKERLDSLQRENNVMASQLSIISKKINFLFDHDIDFEEANPSIMLNRSPDPTHRCPNGKLVLSADMCLEPEVKPTPKPNNAEQKSESPRRKTKKASAESNEKKSSKEKRSSKEKKASKGKKSSKENNESNEKKQRKGPFEENEYFEYSEEQLEFLKAHFGPASNYEKYIDTPMESFVNREMRQLNEQRLKNKKSSEENSGEKRRNHKEHHDDDDDDDDDSRWDEKLAQQREAARRQNEKRMDSAEKPQKNWFIKRGNGRERYRDGSSGERAYFR